MARALRKLTDRTVKAAHDPGRYGDGGGLYLVVTPTGTKNWAFLYSHSGRRREMGLGGYPVIPLARARDLADECRTALAAGDDPKDARDKGEVPTFAEAVEQFLGAMEGQWRNDKHRAQWRMTLGDTYCTAILGKRVSEIGTEDVLRVLSPVWNARNETASRLRGRIERVLSFAKGRGWREGENPALWRGHLDALLPRRQKLQRGHHAAMAYRDVPAFLDRLSGVDTDGRACLAFTILTAARSGEALEATWDEIDIEAGLWTVPAHRMKAGRLHRVPLSEAALTIVKRQAGRKRGAFVFPGAQADRPLSNMALTMILRRMKVAGVTVHGFRSAFRDWAGEETTVAREIAEAALAHVVGDTTERAYRRGDALSKRRVLMDAWASYCRNPAPANVVPMRGRA